MGVFCVFIMFSVRQTEFLLRHSRSAGYFKELLFSAIFVFVLVELFKPMTCLGDYKRTHQCAKLSIFSRNAICKPHMNGDWNILLAFHIGHLFHLGLGQLGRLYLKIYQ